MVTLPKRVRDTETEKITRGEILRQFTNVRGKDGCEGVGRRAPRGKYPECCAKRPDLREFLPTENQNFRYTRTPSCREIVLYDCGPDGITVLDVRIEIRNGGDRSLRLGPVSGAFVFP